MSQKTDKAKIYNSREWKALRAAKLTANPLCEVCESKGIYVSARAVHHKEPIESFNTYRAMREAALRWDNLMSVCFQCHSDIHREMNSRTKAGHERATQAAVERWAAKHQNSGAVIFPEGHPESEIH